MTELQSSDQKIFCISFQRTGTTSVGRFFSSHGYAVGTYPVSSRNSWSKMLFEGNYEQIFASKDFINSQAFEDAPWWCMDFYRFLYHRFPNAKFVFFTRNSDEWFDSMMWHSGGKTLGNTWMHTKLYRREDEFYQKIWSKRREYDIEEIDNLLDLNESHRAHYKMIYETRNREVLDFFEHNDSSRLIHLKLEDKDKWQKLGKFFNIEIIPGFEVVANASQK